MRGEASVRLARERWRTVKFCAAIWSLRVSMTDRRIGSASASARNSEKEMPPSERGI
jgi:hypothetical protein